MPILTIGSAHLENVHGLDRVFVQLVPMFWVKIIPTEFPFILERFQGSLVLRQLALPTGAVWSHGLYFFHYVLLDKHGQEYLAYQHRAYGVAPFLHGKVLNQGSIIWVWERRLLRSNDPSPYTLFSSKMRMGQDWTSL